MMHRNFKFCFFILFFATAITGPARADNWNFDRVSEVSIFPTYIHLPSLLNANPSEQEDVYLFVNTRVTGANRNFSFDIQPEMRTMEGSKDLLSPMRVDVQSPNRLMSLNSKLNSSPRNETVLDLERLNVNYRVGSAEFSLGRKPVSLGVLSVFPVWNKFTRPLIVDFGPLRTFNQDQASVRYQSGAWMFQAIDIEERTVERATRIGEITWYGDGFEIHFLGGEWWQSGAFGVAAIQDIKGFSFRLEEISFSGDGVQLGAGVERALNEHWSFLGEYLYLERGDSSTDQYLVVPLSQFRPLLAKNYGFVRFEYKQGQLWTFQLGSLINFLDRSELLNPNVRYSLSNDTDLSLEGRLPIGADKAELSRALMPTQLLLGLRTAF